MGTIIRKRINYTGGSSLPDGGTTGQVLAKKSNANQDVEWKDGEAFVAAYDQTSYADVIAAIGANKAIMLDMPANNNLFNITYATYTNGGNAIMHTIYKSNDRPTLMTATLTPADNWTIAHTDLQDRLASGENIKTVNGESILGSGNLDVGGGTVDSAMSDTSENAVQNKVIKAYVDQKAEIGTSGGGTDPLNASVSNASGSIQFAEQTNGNVYFQIAAESDDPFSTTLASREFVENNLGDLSNLTTDEKTNLVGAINEVNAKTGNNFEVGVEKWYGTYTDENGTTYQVYTKTIYIPALPSTAGVTSYPHGITGIKQILSVYGFCTNSMVMNAPRQTIQDNICIYQVQKSGNIQIEVGKDRSSVGGYVVLIYAKNN